MALFTSEELLAVTRRSSDQLELVSEEILDQDRWSTYYEYVFRSDPERVHGGGPLYCFVHGVGSTEYQEDDEIDPNEVFPVVAKAVTVTQYHRYVPLSEKITNG